MSVLHVALLQMTACGVDQDANLAKGEAYCRRARALGADIAPFPEMWNIGYSSFWPETDASSNIWRAPERWEAEGIESAIEADTIAEARAQWQARAIGRDDPFIRHFQDLARELEMAIALTYMERWPGAPRNTVSLIDRHGEIVLTYAKVHTCDFDVMEAACTPGDGFFVAPLDTAQGVVQVGAMICYDREFPESARVLMLKGAEIILTPNACDLEINRLSQFRTRAYENMVGMAMTNYAGPRFGHSVAFDGIGFGSGGSRDMLLVEAGEQEGIFLAPFDLDALRDFRLRETWGNAFRRPHRYGALVSAEVEPPFVRVDPTGARYDRIRR